MRSRWARRPSRSAASHSRSRGQQRSNASWVISTRSRPSVTSRCAVNASSTSAVSGSSSSSSRASVRLVSSVPSLTAVSRVNNDRARSR
nr:hypothetical protein [Lentzea guizhouensis]